MAKRKKKVPVSQGFVPTKKQYKILQKVGVYFSRDELKELENMLNDPKTGLAASSDMPSPAYHR